MRDRSLISLGLLKSSLRRFWPLWLAGFVVLLLYFDVPLYAQVMETLRYGGSLADKCSSVESMWSVMHIEAWFFALASAIIASISQNEHLFDSRAATFVGSLPLRRPVVFATHYLAGLLPLLVLPALAALCMLPLHAIAGPVLPLLGIVRWYLLTALLSFCLYAFAQLACQLSGTRIVAVLLYGVIDFLAIALREAVNLVICSLVYGLDMGITAADWLSPGAWLLIHVAGGEGSNPEWLPLGTCALAAVGVAALTCALYVRRDLESASDSVAVPSLRPVLKYLAGISMALLFGSIFCLLILEGDLPASNGQAAALLAMLVVGGLLGVLFAEMIMSRSARVLGRCWRGALVVSALSVAFVGGCLLDPFGVAHYVPEVGEVNEVVVGSSLIGTPGTFSSPEGIANACELQRDVIAFGGRGDDLSGSIQIELTWHLVGGRIVERRYRIPSCFYQYRNDEMPADEGALLIERMLELEDSPEGRASRFAAVLDQRPDDLYFELEYRSNDSEDVYTTITLTPAESAQLVEDGLRQDLLEGQAGNAFEPYDGEGGLDAELRGYSPTEAADDSGSSYTAMVDNDRIVRQLFDMQLNERAMPHTLDWIHAHYPGVELLAW